jgi:hypothetical protein
MQGRATLATPEELTLLHAMIRDLARRFSVKIIIDRLFLEAGQAPASTTLATLVTAIDVANAEAGTVRAQVFTAVSDDTHPPSFASTYEPLLSGFQELKLRPADGSLVNRLLHFWQEHYRVKLAEPLLDELARRLRAASLPVGVLAQRLAEQYGTTIGNDELAWMGRKYPDQWPTLDVKVPT